MTTLYSITYQKHPHALLLKTSLAQMCVELWTSWKRLLQSNWTELPSCTWFVQKQKIQWVPAITFPWHGGKNQRWKVIRKGEFYSLICPGSRAGPWSEKQPTKGWGCFSRSLAANGTRGQLFRLPVARQASKAQQKPPQKPTNDQIKSFSNGPTTQ